MQDNHDAPRQSQQEGIDRCSLRRSLEVARDPPAAAHVTIEDNQSNRVGTDAPGDQLARWYRACHCNGQDCRIEDMAGHRMWGDPGDDLKLPTLKLGKRCFHVWLGGSIATFSLPCRHSAQGSLHGYPRSDSAAGDGGDSEDLMGFVDGPSLQTHL